MAFWGIEPPETFKNTLAICSIFFICIAKADCEVVKDNNDQTYEVPQATTQRNFVNQHQLQFAKFQGQWLSITSIV